MKHVLIIIALALFIFGTIGCEQADRAIDAVGKAKELKTELEKTANEVKKDITAKSEALLEKAKKTADGVIVPAEKDGRESEPTGRSQTEEEGTRKKDHKNKKD